MRIPKWRTERYAIWSACERFGILPPDIKASWDDNDVFGQAVLIAYNHIRLIEEDEKLASSQALNSPL